MCADLVLPFGACRAGRAFLVASRSARHCLSVLGALFTFLFFFLSHTVECVAGSAGQERARATVLFGEAVEKTFSCLVTSPALFVQSGGSPSVVTGSVRASTAIAVGRESRAWSCCCLCARPRTRRCCPRSFCFYISKLFSVFVHTACF